MHTAPSIPPAPRRALRTVWLLTIAIISFLPVTSATAQLGELRAGARVRLRAPGAVAGEVEGVVLGQHADTIVLAIGGAAPVPVHLASITAASVYRGGSRGAGARKGARWGAAVGLGLGVINVGFSDCSGEHCGGAEKAAGVVILTGVGAGVGALIGAAIRAEQWERLFIPP